MIYLSNFQLIIIKSNNSICLHQCYIKIYIFKFLQSQRSNVPSKFHYFTIISLYIYAKLLYSHQLRKHSPDKIFQNGKKNDDETSNCWIPRNDQTLVKWSIPVNEYKHHYKNFQRLANKLNADIKSSVR